MSILIAVMVFLLFSAGVFLMTRRNTFELLLGTLLISHGALLTLIAQGGWTAMEHAPVLRDPKHINVAQYADPLPQALILTAIVISFGVTAYLVVLVARGSEESASETLGEMGREDNEP